MPSQIEAMPHFEGILVHDHWRPYFNLKCQHALCTAHHLRELTYAHEQEYQQWAEAMRILLLEIHEEVKKQGGKLSMDSAEAHLKAYRKILAAANIECPEPIRPAGKKDESNAVSPATSSNGSFTSKPKT